MSINNKLMFRKRLNRLMYLLMIFLICTQSANAFSSEPIVSYSHIYCGQAYLLQLFEDGQVEYRGLYGVKLLGKRSNKISEEALNKLLIKAEDSGFFLVDDRLDLPLRQRAMPKNGIRIKKGDKSTTLFNINSYNKKFMPILDDFIKITKSEQLTGKIRDGCSHDEFIRYKFIKIQK